MDSVYIDCMGLTFPEIMELGDKIKQLALEYNISTGALCVHTSKDDFLSKLPDLRERILDKGESSVAVMADELRTMRR